MYVVVSIWISTAELAHPILGVFHISTHECQGQLYAAHITVFWEMKTRDDSLFFPTQVSSCLDACEKLQETDRYPPAVADELNVELAFAFPILQRISRTRWEGFHI